MKIAIVDDEPVYTEQMKLLCREFGAKSGEMAEPVCFSGGNEFLKDFQFGLYQIIFMDVFMEGSNGIDTARKLREIDHSCVLIFLTSSSDFMPDAFSCHAFDYITKPVTADRVFQVLEDARRYFPKQKPGIRIVCGRQTIPLLLSDIMSVVNDAHYLNIQLKNGNRLRTRMTSENFLRLTNHDPRFLSANRGILVNADFICAINKESCILTDGTSFPIRVRDSQKLENALRQYHFTWLRNERHHDSIGFLPHKYKEDTNE